MASKYHYVYQEIKSRIIDGIYVPGSLLPPEGALEKEYKCSRTTIRSAIRLLVDEGYVDVKQGHGTTVRDIKSVQNLSKITSITETLIAHGYTVTVPAMNIETVEASEKVAGMLDIEPGQPVYKLERIILADDVPFSIMKNYLSHDLLPDFEKYCNQFTGLYRFLEKTYGIELFEAKERITARAANFTQSQILHVPIGTPLLLIKRTSTCSKGLIEYCEINMIAARYEYEVTLFGR